MGLLDELFGGGRQQGFQDLGESLGQGQQAIRQASERGLGFLQPFQAGGTQALASLQQLLGQDPTQTIGDIQSKFQESPGFKFQEQAGQEALQNKLQALGLGGSGVAAREAGQLASNFANQGLQQFTQNVLGQRQQQLGGLENLFQGGLGASGQAAGLATGEGSQLANLFGQMGQSRFGEDVARSQGLTGLFKGIGSGIGALSGAGGFPGAAKKFSSLF